MPTNKYNTNEHERPLMVWIVQIILLLFCIAIMGPSWQHFHYCSGIDPVQNCWLNVFFRTLIANLFWLGVVLGLFYGLEKGLPYARWLAGILIIVWAIAGIHDMHYTQFIFRAMEPGKGFHTPPYECWRSENSWSNVVISCGYSSYAQLIRRILWEVSTLIVIILSGLWFIVNKNSKRYFTQKTIK